MARTTTLVNARTPWAWALGGAALGLLLATVLFAPAVWLAGSVQAASSGQVLLQDARGTVWNGSSQLTLTGGPGSSDSSTLPGRLAWRLQPGWGQLHISVLADCCMQTPLALELLPRWGGAQLRMADQRSQWPALLPAASYALVATIVSGPASALRWQLGALAAPLAAQIGKHGSLRCGEELHFPGGRVLQIERSFFPGEGTGLAEELCPCRNRRSRPNLRSIRRRLCFAPSREP